MPEKSKRLSYRRAIYFVDPDAHDLEQYIRSCLSSFSTIEERRISWSDSFTMEIRHYRRKRNGGVLVHLAGYTPGEEASIVPLEDNLAQADLETAPPPANSDYMDGDIMLFIRGNNVLLCSNDLHESRARTFLQALFEKAGLDDDAGQFELSRVADADKVQLIADHGVKTLKLNASLYEASIARAQRHSIKRKLAGSMWDEIKGMFSHDPRLEEIEESENLSAEIVLKFDRRKKGGELGQERLAALAESVVEEEDEGFSIETFGGETIRSDQIVLKKTVLIEAQGKSVQYGMAFSERGTYYKELVEDGLLEH